MAVRYRNPVIAGFHPDPSICRVGEDYYLAVSSFEYFPGVPLFHSRDLVHWTQIGHALNRPSQLNLTGTACSEGIYAPTLRHHDGRFHLVTTHVWSGGGNFYVWTDDIHANAWSEPVWLDDPDWFDPSLCFASDGRVYYTRRSAHQIVQSEFDPVRGRLLSAPRPIAAPFVSRDGEGPHVYEIAGRYYLLTAEGGTAAGHMICIGRSDTPWGPFEPCPHNPILTHARQTALQVRSTGHGDLFQAHDGTWWLVCLGTRHQPRNGAAFHHLGRETLLAPVTWRDGWPVINGGCCLSLDMEVTSLPAWQPPVTPEAVRRPFALAPGSRTLGFEWTHLRNPTPGSWQLIDADVLLLHGSSSRLDDVAAPAFVGRRLDSPGFRAETRLSFASTQSGDEAGFTLLLSNTFHAEIGLRIHEGGTPYVFVRRRAGDLAADVFLAAHPGGAVRLEISGDWDFVRFAWAAGDGPLIGVAQAERRFFCTEVAGGWTGCVLGLYAQGQGRTCAKPAAFASFDYERRALPEGSAYPWPESDIAF